MSLTQTYNALEEAVTEGLQDGIGYLVNDAHNQAERDEAKRRILTSVGEIRGLLDDIERRTRDA